MNFFRLVSMLVVYSGVVNFILSSAYSDANPLRYPLYYTFCLVFCVSIYTLLSREPGFSKWLYYMLVFSLSLQVVLSFFVVSELQSRFTIFFNNPNQLGYYSILSLLLITLLNHRLNQPKWLLYLGMAMGLYLGFLSASKAIILSNFLFMFGYAVVALIEKNPKQVIAVTLCGLLGYTAAEAAYNFVKLDTDVSRSDDKQHASGSSALPRTRGMIAQRIITTGQDNDDDITERGYLRIVEHPGYLVFGAGEGVHSRFTKDREFHSSFGTLVFSYGLVGIYILFELSRLLVFKLRWHTLIYVAPLIIYSLTHNGLRNPLLWLLLMLIILGDQLAGSPARRNEA